MTWLQAILGALAVYRATRLIVVDDVTAPLRARARGWVAELVECPWCTSLWCSIPTAWAVVYYGENRVVLTVLATGAFSAVAGLISRWASE